MTTFSLADVRDVTQSLTPARSSVVLRLAEGREGLVKEVTPGQALVLWLSDLLNLYTQLPADQQDLIICRFSRDLEDFGRRLWLLLEEFESGKGQPDLAVAHLTLWDRRYVSLTGRDRYLDIRRDSWITDLPGAVLFAESIDLTTLFTRCRARSLKRQEQKKEPSHAGRSKDAPPA